MTAPGQPGQTDQTRTATVRLQADTESYNRQMAAAGQQTNVLVSAVNKLTLSLDGLFKAAGHSLSIVGKADLGMLAGATASAAIYEKQLSTLRATSAVTGQSMSGMSHAIDAATKRFPTSRGQVVELATALTSLGVTGVKNIGDLTQTFIKLGAATGESSLGLAAGLTQLSRQFGQTNAGSIGNYANALLTVSKNAGVSATGVLDFSQSIAPMARQAGIGETAVLGIATAFSKAGADGYVASNTFNSIINDITQLARTGSPALAKYSSFLGMTVDQFKAMPSADKMTAIFASIAKGGPQALNFVNALGLGTRSMTAVQAVAQSGGMGTFIRQAESSSGGQGTLDAASKAAFHDFTDSLSRVHNQFTLLAEQIGGPVLKVLTPLVSGFASFLHVITAIVKALGPLPAIVATVAAPLALLGGGALSHAGLIGGAALARTVLSPNSGPRAAYRYGRESGAAAAAGMSGPQLLALNRGSRMYNRVDARGNPDPDAQRMPMRARGMYLLGARQGGTRGPAVAPGTPAGGFAAGFGRTFSGRPYSYAPPNAAEPHLRYTLTRQAEQAERAAAYAPRHGVAPVPASVLRDPGWARRASADALRMPMALPSWFLTQQARGLRDSRLSGLDRSLYTTPTRGPAASLRQFDAETKARLAEAGIIRTVTADLGLLGRAATTAAAETARAGASVAGAGARAGAHRAGAVLGVTPARAARLGEVERAAATGAPLGATRRMAGAGAGMLARGAMGLGGMLFSPLGMLTMGLPLALAGMHYVQSRTAAHDERNVTGGLDPLAKMNDQLGIATAHLSNFSTALSDASTTTASSWRGAQSVSQDDVAKYGAAGGGKSKDATVNALAKYGRGNVGQAVALGRSYGMTSPAQLQLFGQNLLGAGYTQEQANKVLGQLEVGQAPNLTTMARAVARTEGRGFLGHAASQSGNKLVAATLSGINTTMQSDLDTHSGAYAQTKYLRSGLQFGGALAGQVGTGKGANAREGALANALAVLTHGKTSDFRAIMDSPVGSPLHLDATALAHGSPARQQAYIMSLLRNSESGSKFLANVTAGGGTTDLSQISTVLARTQGAASLSQLTAGAKYGTLGQLATSDATVRAATGSESAAPDVQQRAVEKLAATAATTSTTMSGAAGQLDRLSDSLGAADTPAGALIADAAQFSRTLAGFRLPYVGRAAQMQQSTQGLNADYATAHATGATVADKAQYRTSLGNYQQAKAADYDWLKSMYTQGRAFDTAERRAKEDQHTQLTRSERDFHIGLQQAEEDFNRNRMRSNRDFGIQLGRESEDAAKSMYDPFRRVQAEYTADAGTVSQNLADQNERMAQQARQLAQVHKMGLSDKTIKGLNLADPAQAQQLNELVSSLQQNPELTTQLNRQSDRRARLAKGLTQNKYNVGYDREIADHKRQLADALKDQQTSENRAQQAQTRSLNDTAINNKRALKRAGQDLAESMREITGNFGKVYNKTFSEWAGAVSKWAPNAGAIVQHQLDALKEKNPELFDAAFTGSSSGQGAGVTNPDGTSAGNTGNRGQGIGAGVYEHALGGISTREHIARISENNKAEAVIPLDSRGAAFMGGMYISIARAMVQQLHVGSRPVAPSGDSRVHQDYSTTFTGDITVKEVSDVKKMVAELTRRQRLGRLAAPAHSRA